MLADPVGTITKLTEAVRQLATIDPVLVGKAAVEMAANSPELLKQGAAAIGETKVSEAAHAAGKLVGVAAAEVILAKSAAVAFKGITLLGKTESLMKLLREIVGATQKAKHTIASIPIPVKAAEIVLSDGSRVKLPFGSTGDVPVPADYDGDGKTDVAVFRGGTWFSLNSTAGFNAVQFGLADDKPIPAAYIR